MLCSHTTFIGCLASDQGSAGLGRRPCYISRRRQSQRRRKQAVSTLRDGGRGGKGLVRSPFFMFSLCKGGQSISALFAQSWGGRADLLYGHSSQDEEFLRQERENPREDGHAQNTERWGGGMKTLDEGGGGESLREEPHALTVGRGGE